MFSESFLPANRSFDADVPDAAAVSARSTRFGSEFGGTETGDPQDAVVPAEITAETATSHYGNWDDLPATPADTVTQVGGRAVVTPPAADVSGSTDTYLARATSPSPTPQRTTAPQVPSNLDETGLDVNALQELTLRHIAAVGVMTGGELGQRMRLPITGVTEELVHSLRKEGLVELMSGGSSFLGITGMRLRATERGMEKAHVLMARNGYVGPAPVSLHDFDEVLRQQAGYSHMVERAAVHSAVGHLVLAEETVDRLGAGLEAGGPILLYGHAGNGKTSLAASIAWMLSGGCFIPHAVDIDGYIMRVFDPDVHEPLPTNGLPGSMDTRWVYCQRPFVRAGAELQLQGLDLHFNKQQNMYDCPLQLKATGGVLLIDDLGAQQCAVSDLLNRCLEPLASRTDHLTTLTGRRVPVPFTSLLVMATSGEPCRLLDDTHLRRVPCKIEVPDPTKENFQQLLRMACNDAVVDYDDAGIDYLVKRCYTSTQRPLRAAHPSDLIRLVIAAARYFGEPPCLDTRLVDMAADLYFLSGSPA